MIYANLPSLRATGKQNKGNRSRHRFRSGENRFYADKGRLLRGLGDGPGSVPWQSEVLPAQFHHEQAWSGAQRLWYEVLCDAVALVQGIRGPLHGKLSREREEALLWIQSTRSRSLADFETICRALNLDASWIRMGVLGREAA